VTAGNGTVEFDICHDVNGRLDHFTAPWFCVSLEGSQPATSEQVALAVSANICP
jgi:hypothetical protein